MPRPNSNVYHDIAGTGITVIETVKGDAFVIDTADRAIAQRHCWSIHEHGYARASTRTSRGMKTVYLHRLICPTSITSQHVDHINGNSGDCRSANLRPCTRRENMRNQRLRKNNRSGFKGVGLHRQSGKYRARVVGPGNTHIGLYPTPEEASVAAVVARNARHKEFARHA
jgi:hypothetical protein